MFARSTTFHGRPEKIDAGIRYVQHEAGPMLDKIEGWQVGDRHQRMHHPDNHSARRALTLARKRAAQPRR